MTAETAKQIISMGPPKNIATIEPMIPTSELVPKLPVAHAVSNNVKKLPSHAVLEAVIIENSRVPGSSLKLPKQHRRYPLMRCPRLKELSY